MGAGELERTLVYPAHEVMKMLAPRGHAQAKVELVHQPGFATTHRSPEVNPEDRRTPLMQGLVAGLQGIHGAALGIVGDEAQLGSGVLISSERRVESHARHYDLQGDIQP